MPDTKPILLDRVPTPGQALPNVLVQHHYGVNYKEAWDLQTELHQELVARKRRNTKAEQEQRIIEPLHHYLLFVEHPPVYTLGKSGSVDNLLLDEKGLQQEGIEYYKINRGGDITYHGPGQLVVYPIFDLDEFFTDVHRYVRCLEEGIIRTLADFGILDAYRESGYTGVWLPPKAGKGKRKICAIGVHLSRWVSMHGLAFNVTPNLQHFGHIIPCGIQEDDRGVTSLAQELGRPISLEEVQPVVEKYFREVYAF